MISKDLPTTMERRILDTTLREIIFLVELRKRSEIKEAATKVQQPKWRWTEHRSQKVSTRYDNPESHRGKREQELAQM